MKPIPVPEPRPFTVEAKYLSERREAILKWAGPKWALHPQSTSKPLLPQQEANRG